MTIVDAKGGFVLLPGMIAVSSCSAMPLAD